MSRCFVLKILLSLSLYMIVPSHASRDDEADVLDTDDEQLDAEAVLQENRVISNGTDEFVFVCHSFCVICNDDKRAVYIRRSKSKLFYEGAAYLGVAALLPFVVAGAAASKAVNYVVGGDTKKSLDELSDVCNGVSLLAFQWNQSGEPDWKDQVKVDDIDKVWKDQVANQTGRTRWRTRLEEPGDGPDHNLVYLKKDMDKVKKFGGGEPIGSDEVFKNVFEESGFVCGQHGGVKKIEEEGMGKGVLNSMMSLGGNRKGAGYFNTCKDAAKAAAKAEEPVAEVKEGTPESEPAAAKAEESVAGVKEATPEPEPVAAKTEEPVAEVKEAMPVPEPAGKSKRQRWK